MSCIEPAKAMISATSANINKLFVGSIKEINISESQNIKKISAFDMYAQTLAAAETKSIRS